MVIVFCFACLSFLTFGDPDDTRLNDTLATGFIALLFSTVGSYVFGAVWHDRGLMGFLPAPRKWRSRPCHGNSCGIIP